MWFLFGGSFVEGREKMTCCFGRVVFGYRKYLNVVEVVYGGFERFFRIF